jgi:hypothetical protein
MANYYSTTTVLSTNMVGVTFDTSTTNLASNMIVEAQNEINKYLSKRYDMSSYLTTSAYSTMPPLLLSLCDRLAEGYMWIRLSRGSKESIARGKEMIADVKANLIDLRDNKADLIGLTGSPTTELENPDNVLSNTEDYHATFDEDDPLNWSVDSDKLDAIDSDRS